MPSTLTARTTMLVLAGWNVFDIVLHIAVDQVEPPRIAGNIVALAAVGAVQVVGSGQRATIVCVLAAIAVLACNGIWLADEGSLPPIAAVLIGGTLALLIWAAWRFLKPAAETV